MRCSDEHGPREVDRPGLPAAVEVAELLADEMREDIGEEKMGMDCARKLGLEWSRPVKPEAPSTV